MNKSHIIGIISSSKSSIKRVTIMKIGMISLGCSKNLVDSEMIMGLLTKMGATIVNDEKDADIIFINTCGFIEPAKKEAIDTILEMSDARKKGAKLVVCGCLVERYLDDLKKSLPEVDLFIPIKDYPRFGDLIAPLMNLGFSEKLHHNNRVISTYPHMAYVKISEGCDNRCHYCAIPLIRGPFRSKSEEEILDEIKTLTKRGVKEIVLISQDTTRYGTDLNNGTSLEKLLLDIVKIEGIEILRFLYLYPEEMTENLVKIVKENPVIAPYFDVPIQHASNKVLKEMNRRDTKEGMEKIFTFIRKEIPNAILRTTVIVGYPGETKEDFQELEDFIKKIEFDRLGCFTYSKEEDTVAYSLPHQIRKDVKERRFNRIMAIQQEISYKKGLERIGEIHKTVIEDYDKESKKYVGRSYAFAPDDIDGVIFVESKKDLEFGSFYNVKITDADLYNLYGEVMD